MFDHVLSPRIHPSARCRLTGVIQTLFLPNKKKYCTSPGPALLTNARSVFGGPSPQNGNTSGFRRTFEAQALDAHVARKTRPAPPRSRSTPPTSTRCLASRRHTSSGDPRSRTGLQFGQAIVKEGARRLGIYKCIYLHTCALLAQRPRAVFRPFLRR